MTVNEFKEKIEKTYHRKFPRSACKVKPVSMIGKCIFIDCYLAENLNECLYRIAQNDMFKISFEIELPSAFNFEADDMGENTMKTLSHCYTIKPKNPYVYCDVRSISYRKVTGNAEKIISTFEKFVDKLYNQLVADIEAGNIHDNFKEILSKKIYEKFHTI